MADGLQMRRLFLAGFWQVSCLLNAQAMEGKAGEVGKPLRCFRGGARQSPQQTRKALLGCFPVSDEGGLRFGKGSRAGNIRVACTMWRGPQGILDKKQHSRFR